MANLGSLGKIVSELRTERTNLVNQLRHVDAALAVLGKINSGSHYTKPRRALSATARARISAAQKARWAKTKNQKVVPISSKKHHISAAGIARIRAAAKKRWAKVRAAKK